MDNQGLYESKQLGDGEVGVATGRRAGRSGSTSANALTQWTNMMTGERLDRAELHEWRSRAGRLYEANAHIFEDEVDALNALGILPPIPIPSPLSVPVA